MDVRYYVAFLTEWMGAIAVTWLFALSPQFRKPVIGFKYARRDGLVALGVYALLIIFTFLFYLVNHPDLPNPLRIAPAPINDLKQAFFVAGIGVLPFLAAMISRKQPVRSIGWNAAVFRPSLQLGFALALLTIFLRNRVMDMLAGVSSTQIALLLLAVGVSLLEETIFRGFIQTRLAWWLGQWPGILLTALMFALWHTPAWLNNVPVQTGLILFGLTFAQGIVLGWIMRKSGNVIAPAFYRALSIWMNFFV